MQLIKMNEDLKDLLNRNARFVTMFLVASIIFVGVTIKDYPSKWWVSLLAITIIFAFFFILLNARVFFKATLTVILVLIESSWAYKSSIDVVHSATLPSVWLLTIILSFFCILSISYMVISGRSRWSCISLSVTGGFIASYFLMGFNFNEIASVALGFITTLALFILLYRYNRKSFYSSTKMPNTFIDESVYERIFKQAIDTGWGAKIINKRNGMSSIIIWNDDHAYNLMAVELDQEFGNGGIKKPFLTYHGKNINPWLLNLSMNYTPLFKTRGAPILLVLLDKNNKNGSQSRVIGVQIPDTKNKVPVAITPTHREFSKGEYMDLFKRIDDSFKDFVTPLTSKQVKILDRLLPDELLEKDANLVQIEK